MTIADKGYDSNDIQRHIEKNDAICVIPYRKSRWSHDLIKDNYDKTLYASRNFIERLFSQIKENKRVATRFDKLEVCLNSFIALALIKPSTYFVNSAMALPIDVKNEKAL